MPRVLLAGLLILLAGVAAQAAEIRAVVRVTSGVDRHLLSRIRGQTSDLPVALVSARTGPLEPSLADQLETADRLAETHGAQAVVWFDTRRHEVELLVYVSEVAARKIFARTIRADERRPGSGTLEAAAVMVRTALRAQTLNTSLGEDRDVVLARLERPPRAMAPAPPPLALPPEAEGPARARDPGVATEWMVGLGWQAAMDGHSARGQQGPAVAVHLLRGWLALALHILPGIPGVVEDDLARIVLTRHAAGLLGGVHVELGWGLDLTGGVLLGVAVFHRSTDPESPRVQATPDSWSTSLLVAPQLGLGWRVWRRLRLGLDLAADVVPRAPLLGYEAVSPGEPLPEHDLWRVQPRAGLMLHLLLP